MSVATVMPSSSVLPSGPFSKGHHCDENMIHGSKAEELTVEDNALSMLGSLPEDASFYKDETATDESPEKKRGWFGKIGKSLSWGRTKGLKIDEKSALAAVMACRSDSASQYGGMASQDPAQAKLVRSVLALMIRQMGKNLLKGANVMNVSFPIQCCQPGTILEVAALQAG